MNTTTAQWPEIMPENKRNVIIQLIYSSAKSDEEREKWLDYLESSSNDDSDEIIESLSNTSDL